jgi:hypothetical protein
MHVRISIALTTLLGVVAPSPHVASAQQISRQNLVTFAQDPARVAALKRGVAVMKSRKPSDPKSWFFQAAIHGVSPEFVAEALARDPDVAKVDQAKFWNQCPHAGQVSAEFLIWHRAYLFYFEQILREAAGDSQLSVPYWAYNEADRGFPAIFGDPDPDPRTGEPRNPLFDVQREAAFVFGVYELSDEAVSTQLSDAEKRFFGPSEREGFAGGVADSNPLTQGLAERSPHNSIHFAVGGAIGNAAGSMSDVSTAAFDPIFWVHHANIDRLWSIWDCDATRVWGAVPPRSWFDEKPWVFHDVTLSLKRLSRLEYIKYSTLGISYDSDKPNCTRLSETSPTPVILTNVDNATQPRMARRESIGESNQNISLSAANPVTHELTLNGGPILDAPDLSAALRTKGTETRRVLLELRGISYDAPPSVGYDVYVNIAAGAVPDRTSRNYVGTLNLFGLSHHHATSEAVQSFDVTDAVTATGSDVRRLRVTIVPFNLLSPRRREVSPLGRSGNVTIKSIGVVIAEGARQ